MSIKYTLHNLTEIREAGRCGAISFYCPEIDCDYIYDKTDRTTDTCPKCGTLRRVCGKWNIKGRNRCNRHGGKTLMGVDSSLYKGRGTSKHLPTRLFEYYQMSVVADNNILEMTDDIHLLEARKIQLLAQLDQAGADQLWADARKAFEKFSNARRKAANGSVKASEQMHLAADELETILVKGYAQGAIWKQLLIVIDHQKTAKAWEMKRREKASTIVTAEQVATAMGQIIGFIRNRVSDQDIRKALLNDIQGMMVG